MVHADDPAAQTLSLAASLALIETVDIAVPNQPLMLKWPNDLILSGKKLAGILLERSGDRVAASLGGRTKPEMFAPLLAGTVARLLNLWRKNPPAMLAQAWLARAHSIGTPLTVHSSADETVSGSFDGIEPDGALRLRLADGSLETIRAGDVTL